MKRKIYRQTDNGRERHRDKQRNKERIREKGREKQIEIETDGKGIYFVMKHSFPNNFQ